MSGAPHDGSGAPLDGLTAAIGHRFARAELLNEALTHPSAAGPGSASYERLEFLGDRVLGLALAAHLFATFPDEAEGDLALRHAALVSRDSCTLVAGELRLDLYLHLTPGESRAGSGRRASVLADACEAVIGAIYRDGGFAPARAFIERHWSGRMERTAEPPMDAKTSLQEWAQGRGLALPAYRQLSRSGPDHAPHFTIEVAVGDFTPERGEGPTKRTAEQTAAEKLLERLEGTDGSG